MEKDERERNASSGLLGAFTFTALIAEKKSYIPALFQTAGAISRADRKNFFRLCLYRGLIGLTHSFSRGISALIRRHAN